MDKVTYIETGDKYYTPDHHKDAADVIAAHVANLEHPVIRRKGKKQTAYYNVAAAYDIETTSLSRDGEPWAALMYVWMMSVEGFVVVGRTWREYADWLALLYGALVHATGTYARLPVYVHSLRFEASWLLTQDTGGLTKELFALSRHKPVRLYQEGYGNHYYEVEYRDSAVLAGCALEDIKVNGVQKLVGFLDYDLVRTPLTPLTDKEWLYCIYDVKVLTAYVADKINGDDAHDVVNVPMTRTGYVRETVRANVAEDKKAVQLIRSLRLNNVEDYKFFRWLYQGGYTHASSGRTSRLLRNVSSNDITSSYPTVMVSEKFPMSPFFRDPAADKDDKLFEKYLKSNCCGWVVTLRNLTCVYPHETLITSSKLYHEGDDVGVEGLTPSSREHELTLDNGRILHAPVATLPVNEVDWELIKRCYTWDGPAERHGFRFSRKGYLPRPIVEAVLTFYEIKTKYKGVVGEELSYARAKEVINSIYGACVTDVVHSLIEYSGMWLEIEPDAEEAAKQVCANDSAHKRFLYYPWGVWITSYARRNLWDAILALGPDYVYSDTDSNKYLHYGAHRKWYKGYAKRVSAKIKACCDHHGLDYELSMPYDPGKKDPQTGEYIVPPQRRPLGVYTYEGTYDEFKTLGAKRYATRSAHGVETTVAGCGKYNPKHPDRARLPQYLEKLAAELGGSPLDHFRDELIVPSEYTGKLLCTYLDDCRRDAPSGDVVDYLGFTYHMDDGRGCHLAPMEYRVSLYGNLKEISDRMVSQNEY